MNTKNRKKSNPLFTIVPVCLLLLGLGIMFYPSFSDWYNRLHQSSAVAEYNRTVDTNEAAANQAMWDEAVSYNEKLSQTALENGGSLNFRLSEEEQKQYETVLDVTGTGIMGYIEIPKVKIELPVYHDTSDSVLQIAVGHLAGSSLPVGGESTHSILTGHTGLPSAKLFTDIDQLEEGDTFQLIVLDHVLTYEVDDIRTVLPEETDSLRIEEGKDLCTLVTCTPYGINDHRLLVTGHRIPTPKEDGTPSADWQNDALIVSLQLWLPFILAAAAVAAVVAWILRRRKKAAARKNS